jgi:hypothetical protein
MSLEDRIRRLESQMGGGPNLTPAQLALDCLTMDLASFSPDDNSPIAERLRAKRARLRQAIDNGSTDGLLPGDLEILPPATVLAGD